MSATDEDRETAPAQLSATDMLRRLWPCWDRHFERHPTAGCSQEYRQCFCPKEWRERICAARGLLGFPLGWPDDVEWVDGYLYKKDSTPTPSPWDAVELLRYFRATWDEHCDTDPGGCSETRGRCYCSDNYRAMRNAARALIGLPPAWPDDGSGGCK